MKRSTKPLDILLLILRSVPEPGHILTLLVSRINDLQNPNFLPAPSAEPDPRFMRHVELVTQLRRAGVMQSVEGPRKEVEFDVLIGGYAPEYSQTVREYLALLGLPLPADESKDIVLPVYFARSNRFEIIRVKNFHQPAYGRSCRKSRRCNSGAGFVL
jgi:hypothetical protein